MEVVKENVPSDFHDRSPVWGESSGSARGPFRFLGLHFLQTSNRGLWSQSWRTHPEKVYHPASRMTQTVQHQASANYQFIPAGIPIHGHHGLWILLVKEMDRSHKMSLIARRGFYILLRRLPMDSFIPNHSATVQPVDCSTLPGTTLCSIGQSLATWMVLVAFTEQTPSPPIGCLLAAAATGASRSVAHMVPRGLGDVGSLN